MGNVKHGAKNSTRKSLYAGKGCFSRGEYHAQISDEYFFPDVTKELGKCERAILLRLTRKTMGSQEEPQLTLIVRAAISYLEMHEPYKRTAIKEALDSLETKGLIRKVLTDHKDGNIYFVEPVFLWSDKWHQFQGIEQSRLAELTAKRPTCDESIHSWSEIGQLLTGKRPTRNASPGMELTGKRSQYRSRSSDPTARRVTSPKKSAGGVQGKRSDKGRKESSGQDQKRRKGAGLPAGSINVADLSADKIAPHCAKVRMNKKAEANRLRELKRQAAQLQKEHEEAT